MKFYSIIVCLPLIAFFGIIIFGIISISLEFILEKIEKRLEKNQFVSKRGKFRFEVSYFKEKYKQFKVKRYLDEKILAIYTQMFWQGDSKFTIDCISIILSRDEILGYKIDKLFNKHRLKKVNKYFMLDPHYVHDEIIFLGYGEILDKKILSIIKEVQREVRNSRKMIA